VSCLASRAIGLSFITYGLFSMEGSLFTKTYGQTTCNYPDEPDNDKNMFILDQNRLTKIIKQNKNYLVSNNAISGPNHINTDKLGENKELTQKTELKKIVHAHIKLNTNAPVEKKS
jgi:hypothetical protein